MSFKENLKERREFVFSVLGVGVFLAIGLALAIGGTSHLEFCAAEIAFALLGCTFLACYLLWIKSSKRHTKILRLIWGSLTALGALGIAAIVFFWVPHKEEDFLLAKNPAALTPDNRPDPNLDPYKNLRPDIQYSPPLCKGMLNVIVGGNVFGGVEFPFVALEVKRKPIITIDKDDHDGLLFTFEVLAKDGKMVARVVKNVVTFYPWSYRRPRKTLHSITVEDEEGKIALDIDYVNPHVVLITARLFVGDRFIGIMPMQIDYAHIRDEQGQSFPGITYRNQTTCGVGHTGFSFGQHEQ